MYGTWTKLFVPDAKYRSSSKVKWSNTTQNYEDIKNITNSSFFITGSSYLETSILTPIPTDDELQSRLSLSSIQSAEECTDIIIDHVGSSTSYAAGLARSCYISGLGYMDLPNIYELMVIWCEADNIDNMDPTAEDYPDLKVGYSNPSGRFYGSDNGYVSSSEYSQIRSWCIHYSGETKDSGKIDTTHYVFSVKEL